MSFINNNPSTNAGRIVNMPIDKNMPNKVTNGNVLTWDGVKERWTSGPSAGNTDSYFFGLNIAGTGTILDYTQAGTKYNILISGYTGLNFTMFNTGPGGPTTLTGTSGIPSLIGYQPPSGDPIQTGNFTIIKCLDSGKYLLNLRAIFNPTANDDYGISLNIRNRPAYYLTYPSPPVSIPIYTYFESVCLLFNQQSNVNNTFSFSLVENLQEGDELYLQVESDSTSTLSWTNFTINKIGN